MTDAFDRIIITVPDLSAASAEYSALLDMAGFATTEAGAARACFPLANTVLELCEVGGSEGAVTGLVLRDASAQQAVAPVSNTLDLNIGICDGAAMSRVRDQSSAAAALAIDHLVLRTDDAQACIDLFAEQLGIRLALDKTVAKWGGRMLFFRAGKMTLEVIEAEEGVGGNYFWGIALQCADIGAFCRGLDARGVAHSAVRDGRKPGTLVATVKSHCLGIPTLLIQPSA